MAKFKVYVSSNEIPEKAIQILNLIADTKINKNYGSPTRETLLTEVADVDGLLCLLTDQVDSEVINSSKNLKIIANMAVGYDNINVLEANKRGIIVTNTPGILTETTADLTMAILFALARRIVEADNFVRSGKWVIPWSPMMMVGCDIHNKTLGIYGLGRIGSAVARRAKGFNMKLIYYSAHRKTDLENELNLEYVSLDDLFKESDFLSIHVPLLPETRHSIDIDKLSNMKKTAYIVNTSRGAVIDEQALISVLQNKTIAGAALDVFEDEPIDQNHPLIKLDNVILTPHIGSASIETRTGMAIMAAQNVVTALKGQVPPNLVNKEVLTH